MMIVTSDTDITFRAMARTWGHVYATDLTFSRDREIGVPFGVGVCGGDGLVVGVRGCYYAWVGDCHH